MAASNHPPDSVRQGEFLDTGSLKTKNRMHIPFFEKTKFHSSENRQNRGAEVHSDLPSPRFSHALAAAVNGQTTSPLSELRDSYSPNVMLSKGASKKKRKGSTGSISIHTDFTGLDERPMTPGGILDGYKAGDRSGRDDEKERISGRNQGGSTSWAAFLDDVPGDR